MSSRKGIMTHFGGEPGGLLGEGGGSFKPSTPNLLWFCFLTAEGQNTEILRRGTFPLKTWELALAWLCDRAEGQNRHRQPVGLSIKKTLSQGLWCEAPAARAVLPPASRREATGLETM